MSSVPLLRRLGGMEGNAESVGREDADSKIESDVIIVAWLFPVKCPGRTLADLFDIGKYLRIIAVPSRTIRCQILARGGSSLFLSWGQAL